MPIELKILAWAVVLGLVQLVLQSTTMTLQRGSKWNASPRDGEPKPLVGVGARADRAFHNFLETFPLFAALALAVVAADRTSAATAVGVQVYFWARVAYVPVYLAGIPYLRSAIWIVSLWGLLQLLWALLA